jgi:hypothetical protein
MQKLTDTLARKAAPGAKPVRLYDAEVRGFGLPPAQADRFARRGHVLQQTLGDDAAQHGLSGRDGQFGGRVGQQRIVLRSLAEDHALSIGKLGHCVGLLVRTR